MDVPHLATHEKRVLAELHLPVFDVISMVCLHRTQRRKHGEGEFQRIRIMALQNLELEGPLYRNVNCFHFADWNN